MRGNCRTHHKHNAISSLIKREICIRGGEGRKRGRERGEVGGGWKKKREGKKEGVEREIERVRLTRIRYLICTCILRIRYNMYVYIGSCF